ncbi:TIGR00730 family Rossman fold protein [Macrococcus equipercicus]|uniref:Cytokinin riboside 5'-monophosphate phosphoribohydrolase n=1 Tax=Macrococcus equipercicus TaxID=69967 RepID=A0A9Q9BW10_9STAP|nr:TIGR00730 family Rossman fold protein [Macrococcus equipercicus]KAA1042397.1 TIGR00730 family Rossman fold protein [Macrococcus equipercicus]UTH14282.1 TIGR00730 family Rossman fold protein [Macrococcus equipercicus]
MKTVAVFCGSRTGAPIYEEHARRLGAQLAARDITLVYGGGKVGLMGAIADSVMTHGGSAIGIIPSFLHSREIAHTGITELHIVETMHERKKMMADLAEGFIMMPGGAGTLEEFFEIFTWAQIGLHHKPVGVLNTHAFYEPLQNMLRHMNQQGFIDTPQLDIAVFDDDPVRLLDHLTQQ